MDAAGLKTTDQQRMQWFCRTCAGPFEYAADSKPKFCPYCRSNDLSDKPAEAEINPDLLPEAADTNFTKGPWIAVENGGDDTDGRKLLVGKYDEFGDFTTIADCRNKWLSDEIGGDEEANARLVSAAPELLEALSVIAGGDGDAQTIARQTLQKLGFM